MEAIQNDYPGKLIRFKKSKMKMYIDTLAYYEMDVARRQIAS